MTFLGTIQSTGSSFLKTAGSTICSLPRYAQVSFGLSGTSFLTGACAHLYSSRKVAEYTDDESSGDVPQAWDDAINARGRYDQGLKSLPLKLRYTFLESPWRGANILYSISALSLVVGAGITLNAWRKAQPVKVVKPAPAPKPAPKPVVAKPAPKPVAKPVAKPVTTTSAS